VKRIAYNITSIETQAKAVGIRLEPLGTPGAEVASWSVLGVGALAILSWFADSGFRYRAKFGRRWKIYRRGARLSPILTEIKADMDREKGRLSKLYPEEFDSVS
jgi:hypothetical protein